MIKDEILQEIKKSHDTENEIQQKIFDSSVVMHLSNKLIDDHILSLKNEDRNNGSLF